MINSYFSITNIMLSPDSSKLLLKITPIFAEITAEDIILFLQSSELPQFKVNQGGIEKAVDAFASLYEAGNPDSMKFEPIVIADKKDALLNVDLSTDKMRATANITAAYGGKSVNVFDVKSKCEQLGIKFGLLTKNILGLINISKKASAGKILKIDIAKGEDPIDGHDAQFTMNVNTENHRKPKPKHLENGKVDMLDLGRSITVNAGTVLMVKTPASEGKPGKKITGEIINQKVGVDKAFLVQKNVEIDPNNPLHLIASIHGIPILVKGFIKVDDVLLLESVSHKTGNIIYDGTIVITSDINESMKVNASGDITVMGLIESAKVSCGGDLTVSQPIIGHQKKSDGEFSCEIKCGGNLTGTIAQYAKLRVAKNITLTNQLIHCDTKCKGTIIVHDKNQLKGSVIGGMTEVANGLITTVTGTNGGTKTTITLLSNITELTELKLKYIHDIQSVDETINKFKAHEDKIDRLPEKATNKNVKKLLAFEKQQYRKESDRLQQLLLETKSQLKHSYSRVSLTATSSLHSGTTVNFERQSWVSDKEYGPSWLSLINNSLQITPYEKQEQA